MAQKDITIRIKTVETQLNKSLKKIEKLEGIINKLNSKKVKLNTSPAQRAAQKLRKEIEKGTKIADKLFDASRSSGFGNSIKNVNSQLSLVTKSFNAANSAADRQTRATALIAGNLKKMRMEAAAFAVASGNREALKGGAGNIGIRLKEIREFPKTILAGNQAMNILNGMLELAEVNSKEFLQINKAIGEQLKINASIQEAADKASGVTKKKKQNKDNQRTAQRVKAIKEQTLNIERRIQDSTLTQTTKNQLINNLKRSGVQLDKRELELAKQINIETQRNLTMQEKRQRRRGRIAQSALIGGGFPLLFGGGPVQAAAGALGGGIGEAISPGGGFAGSIAATAAINSLGQIANGTRELAEALQTTSGTLELMADRTLFSSNAIEKQAKALQDQGKEAELAALLTDELTKALGPAGLGQLDDLADDSREMARQFGILKTSMELFLAGPLSKIIKLINSTLTKANIVNQLDKSLTELKKVDPKAYKLAIRELRDDITFVDKLNPVSSTKRSFLGSLINPSNLQVQGVPVGGESKDFLGKFLQNINTKLPTTKLPFQTNTNNDPAKTAKAEESKLDALVKQTLQYDAIVMFGTKEAEIRKQIKEFEEEATEQEKLQIATGKINVRQLIEQNNEAKKLADNAAIIEDSFKRLSDTITQDIGNGIKGLIQGTQSLNDVLRNVTNKIADAFLNMAIFGNFGGGSVTGGLLGMFKANGGSVKGGNPYIVGERGPELFTPGVSGMITPNHALGGSTNVVVNVDASGSNVEGDEQGGRELGRLISVAVQSELVQQKRPGGLLA